MHRELVRELTLAVHTDNEKVIKMVSLLGKAAAQIHSFPVFIRNFKNYLIIIDGRKYPHCEKENCLVRSPVRTKPRLRKLENLLPAGDLLPAGG